MPEKEKMEIGAALDFEELYEAYWPKVLRYVKRMDGGLDAEDIAQEVFLKVAVNLPGFRQESKVSTWIYQIATNAAIDRLRKKQLPQVGEELLDGAQAGEFLSERSHSGGRKVSQPELKLIHREMNSCIRGVVEELPEIYRTVVVLHEMEGLKNREIAEILGVSLDAVKIRLHRGRILLRKTLDERCHFYWDDRNEMACEKKGP